MQFPPFQILQPVRALQRHTPTSSSPIGSTTFPVLRGESGYIGYYWNDGWRFQVTWETMPNSPITYDFKAWEMLVGPEPSATETPVDNRPMYARDTPDTADTYNADDP